MCLQVTDHIYIWSSAKFGIGLSMQPKMSKMFIFLVFNVQGVVNFRLINLVAHVLVRLRSRRPVCFVGLSYFMLFAAFILEVRVVLETLRKMLHINTYRYSQHNNFSYLFAGMKWTNCNPSDNKSPQFHFWMMAAEL